MRLALFRSHIVLQLASCVPQLASCVPHAAHAIFDKFQRCLPCDALRLLDAGPAAAADSFLRVIWNFLILIRIKASASSLLLGWNSLGAGCTTMTRHARPLSDDILVTRRGMKRRKVLVH